MQGMARRRRVEHAPLSHTGCFSKPAHEPEVIANSRKGWLAVQGLVAVAVQRQMVGLPRHPAAQLLVSVKFSRACACCVEAVEIMPSLCLQLAACLLLIYGAHTVRNLGWQDINI